MPSYMLTSTSKYVVTLSVSVCLFICLPVCLCACLSARLSVCVSVCLPLCTLHAHACISTSRRCIGTHPCATLLVRQLSYWLSVCWQHVMPTAIGVFLVRINTIIMCMYMYILSCPLGKPYSVPGFQNQHFGLKVVIHYNFVDYHKNVINLPKYFFLVWSTAFPVLSSFSFAVLH